jgi:hypothetical protein
MEISDLMLGYFLPDGLLDHFDIRGIEHCSDLARKETRYYIILEEKNNIPDGYKAEDYESKGLLPEKLIQDFPIRGIPLYLRIRRRRWRDKLTKKNVIYSNLSLIAQGTKFTQELVDFLKYTGTYERVKHQ